MKAAFLRLLARAGLLGTAYSGYEAVRSLAGRGRAQPWNDLPLPPARLRVQVAGTPDARWFLESGHAATDALTDALARRGQRLDELGSILDFGCGCGRVIRHLASLPGELHGSDANERLVSWCRENLRFARFTRNGLAPPLSYAETSFDLVYALSVFTHLPDALQGLWRDELHRVLRPGGLLVASTHGECYLERLTSPERLRFEAGELVVRWAEVAGTNLCTAFHPPAYLRRHLAEGFSLEEHVPEGALGNPHQDLVVLRRP